MQFLCSDSRISARTDGCLRAVGRCCLFGIVSAVKPQITNTLIKTVYFFIQTFPDLLLPAKFCLLFFVFFLFGTVCRNEFFTIESVSSPDTIPVILIGIIFPPLFYLFSSTIRPASSHTFAIISSVFSGGISLSTFLVSLSIIFMVTRLVAS